MKITWNRTDRKRENKCLITYSVRVARYIFTSYTWPGNRQWILIGALRFLELRKSGNNKKKKREERKSPKWSSFCSRHPPTFLSPRPFAPKHSLKTATVESPQEYLYVIRHVQAPYMRKLILSWCYRLSWNRFNFPSLLLADIIVLMLPSSTL
jgi:hypothetical protein